MRTLQGIELLAHFVEIPTHSASVCPRLGRIERTSLAETLLQSSCANSGGRRLGVVDTFSNISSWGEALQSIETCTNRKLSDSDAGISGTRSRSSAILSSGKLGGAKLRRTRRKFSSRAKHSLERMRSRANLRSTRPFVEHIGVCAVAERSLCHR